MLTARASIVFDVPIERVWEVATDYAGYARFPGVSAARVLEPGPDHPAGLGTLREVRFNGITFVERIVEFDPPHRLGYRIVTSRPIRLDHEGGLMQLRTREAGGTELEWMTTFEVGIPLVGRLITPIARVQVQRSFNAILRFLKAELERSA